MEILSTGEKIKRARVYKGITLKALCEDKISISKMSCIENGKVKAEREILEFVANKLELDVEYLVQDVKEQLLQNLQFIKENINNDKDIEKNIKYNLEYAVEYEYYGLGFEFLHILFSYYLENRSFENIQLIVSQYYDLYQKNNNYENTIIYYRDMASYFYATGEYIEASAYYRKLRENILGESEVNKEEYIYVLYNEGLCYYMIKDNKNAYELMKEAVDNIEYVKDIINKGKIFYAFATICIKLHKVDAMDYVDKAYECQKDNPILVAKAKGEYGACYFEVGEREKAIQEIKEGLEIFPKHNKEKYVEFMNNCLKILLDNGEYEEVNYMSSEALNLAINCDNIKLIERAYYLKGISLIKMNRHREAEVYMNLSLDALFKFGSKEERYERYIDMAEMYHVLGDTSDSVKYFILAMNMEKKKV